MEFWHHVERLVPKHVGNPNIRIVARVVPYRVALHTADSSEEAVVERLHRLLAEITRQRGLFWKTANALGGCQFTTIEPTPGYWRVRTRQLLAYRLADEIPGVILDTTGQRRVDVYESPVRAQLARAVGRVYAYPRLWLKSDPLQMVMLLRALSACRPRLAATFGVFRESHIHDPSAPHRPDRVAE